ncbi:MAG: GTPase HflX [Spirochaetales bacterium]|nr:GTPase HflX [Spirochaetales bacterium]
MGKAYLVGVRLPLETQTWSVEESLDELERLVQTAGLEVGGRARQLLKHVFASTLVGPGKLEEIQTAALATDSDTVVFDEELTPSQQRNLEDFFGEDIIVVDRTAVILEIFAAHARTREGQLQVELAQYEYRLPRLTRMWTHLARQAGGRRGGVGVRGPGETQLEIDRRRIRSKIRRLKTDIEHVRLHREKQREQRRQNNIPVVALAGYTNAGKSTLLKTLSHADILVEDQLFSTLDPTTRRVDLPSGRPVLFSDTVGFINKLPHSLIAAFKATFEEIADANLILHIADSTHPQAHMQRMVVEKELHSIYKTTARILLVWNKIDMNEDIARIHENSAFGEIAISAKTGKNIPLLLAKVEEILNDDMIAMEISLPYSEGKLLHSLHEHCAIQSAVKEETGTRIKLFVPRQMHERLKPFTVSSVQ